jgi:hypothetical protein
VRAVSPPGSDPGRQAGLMSGRERAAPGGSIGIGNAPAIAGTAGGKWGDCDEIYLQLLAKAETAAELPAVRHALRNEPAAPLTALQSARRGIKWIRAGRQSRRASSTVIEGVGNGVSRSWLHVDMGSMPGRHGNSRAGQGRSGHAER